MNHMWTGYFALDWTRRINYVEPVFPHFNKLITAIFVNSSNISDSDEIIKIGKKLSINNVESLISQYYFCRYGIIPPYDLWNSFKGEIKNVLPLPLRAFTSINEMRDCPDLIIIDDLQKAQARVHMPNGQDGLNCSKCNTFFAYVEPPASGKFTCQGCKVFL